MRKDKCTFRPLTTRQGIKFSRMDGRAMLSEYCQSRHRSGSNDMLCRVPQTQTGVILPPYSQHYPASGPRNHPVASGSSNPNPVPRPPQTQPPKKQGRVPAESSKSGQNPLQQQLDAMTQAYARNATAAYVSPSTSTNVPQSSQRIAQPLANGVPSNSVPAEQQQPHYRPHVYGATAAGTVSGPSQTSSSLMTDQTRAQTQAQSQRARGTPAAPSPPIPTHPNAAAGPELPAGQIPSVLKPPAPSTGPAAPPHQSQPQPQRIPPRPPSSPSVAIPVPPPPKERVVDIPSWSTSLINAFKQRCFAHFHNAPAGSTMDMYDKFQFARGFVLQKQQDGIWLVDTRDNMKAPFSGLVGELENRQVPDNAAGTQRSFGGVSAVANTVQASVSMPQLPNQRPPSAPAPASQPGKTAPMGARAEREQQRPADIPARSFAPLRLSTPQNQGTSPAVPRSPADANRRTLAKDILHALGKRDRTAAESEAGPDAKRIFVRDNASSMSTFRLDSNVQQAWPVVQGQGGIIDLSQLPVLPAAPPKPYQPPFAASARTPSRPRTTDPITSARATPPPIAGVTITTGVTVAPSVVVASHQPPLRAPQPRAPVPDRPNEALLAPTVNEFAARTSQPVASSSTPVLSPRLPPIAILDDSGPSGNATPASAGKGRPATGSGRTSTPQLAAGKSGKKGKGRARSATSDAASLPPPSRASSKASRVPPTSSSPGTSAVVDLTSPSPSARAESEGEPLFLASGSPPPSPILGDYSLFTPERRPPSTSQRQQRAYVSIPPASPRTCQFIESMRGKSGKLSKAPTSNRRSSSRATSAVTAGGVGSRRSSSRATSTVVGRVDNLALPPYVAGEGM